MPTSLNDDIFFIGHSLVAFDMPKFLDSFVEVSGGSGTTDLQIINGSSLKYQWENAGGGQGSNAITALSSGEFEVLVMTEAVPLRNALQWSGTVEYATNFVNTAVQGNSDVRVYIYETWHSLNSGTGVAVPWDDYDHIPWRERVETDLELWQGIVDDINSSAASTGSAPAQLIPVGQAFARLYDEIEAGNVPGVSSIREFFKDDIHPNDLGKYFVALVHFATIYGADYADLADLPTTVEAAWWRSVALPTDVTDVLKSIAAETVAEFTGGSVVTPAPVNTAPDALDDSAATDEGDSVDINVLANDDDPDGDALTIAAIGSAANGSVVRVGDELRYTPDAGFSGIDRFTYTVSDGNGGRDTAEVTVTVRDTSPVNTAPTARNDSATVTSGETVMIDVRANDTDPDGDQLSITSVSAAANGTVTIVNGQLRYQANPGTAGTDRLTYTVSDGAGGTAQAVVTVEVLPDETPTPTPTPSPGPSPTLADDVFYVGNSMVSQDIPEFIEGFANSAGGSATTGFERIGGAPLKYAWENSGSGQGSNARTALSSGEYEALILSEATPLKNHLQWSGTVDYAINFVDAAVAGNPDVRVYVHEAWHSLNSGTGTPVPWDADDHIPWRQRLDNDLSLWEGIVDGINQRAASTGAAPAKLIPIGQAFANLHDAIEAGQVAGVSSIRDFFTDDIKTNDMGSYFVALVQYATVYDVGLDGLSDLPSTLQGAWWQTKSIPDGVADALKSIAADTVADYHGAPAPGPVNAAPVAADDTTSVDEGGSVDIDVLANDSDADGDDLDITAFSDPANGNVTRVGDDLRYIADPGFSGQDRFTYTISDGAGGFDTAEVTVTVRAAPPEPVSDAVLINGSELAAIEAYGLNPQGVLQDRGYAEVSADQRSVSLYDNAWKSLSVTYDVTVNTMLSFDFSASRDGEIQGIGFDNDMVLDRQRVYQLNGTQTWGLQDEAGNYTAGSGAQRYDIAVGQDFTGAFDRLVLMADDDAGIGAETTFSDIRIWERGLEVNGTAGAVDAYGVYQGGTLLQDEGIGEVSLDGSAITLTDNAWKSVDFDYTVTENTVLRFTFDADTVGEIHAIGFDSDDRMSASQAFQLAGTDTWGNQSAAGLYDTNLGGEQVIEINVGEHFTGAFDRLFFVGDDDSGEGAMSTFSDIEVFERSPAPTPPTPPGPRPEGVADGLTNPSIAMNLEFVTDYATSVPFINVAKMMREPFALEAGTWEWNRVMSNQDLKDQGYLDANGYPTSLPPGTKIQSLVMTEMPAEAESVSGRYRLTYEGEGDIEMWGSARNVTVENDGIWFDYTAGDGPFGYNINQTDPRGTGNYIRDIEIVREDHIEMHEVGAIFNPKWLEHVQDLRSVRYVDWMETNGSSVSDWSDRSTFDKIVWTDVVPVEVMVALANEVGTDPWFNIPHLATDEYIENFATYVRDNLDPNLKAHFEYSNEVWNFAYGFGQTQWAQQQAEARWGSGTNWMEFVGMKGAQMAQIVDRVFGAEADDRVVNVAGTHVRWLGLEDPLLNAASWVAEDPVNNKAPHEYFDAYAITGYFGNESANARADDVFRWIDESLSAAEAEASSRGLTGSARSDYVEAHKYDLATANVIDEVASGSIDNLITELWPYHREIADRYGLDLIMYEGGTHVDPGAYRWSSPDMVDFFAHLNYTQEMADLYTTLLEAWSGISDGPFTAYNDIAPAGTWGGFGHLRHIDDDTLRWQELQRFNSEVEGWGEVRAEDTFDHGRTVVGTDAANTLVGTVEEDVMIGYGGADTFILAGGSDRAHGGMGTDTAEFIGARSDYVFGQDGDNVIATANGFTVTLRDIELLTFDENPGTTFTIDDVL